MSEIKLKPCPFCGGEAKIKDRIECLGHGDYERFYLVTCCNCYAQSRMCGEEQYVIEAWNRRDGAI